MYNNTKILQREKYVQETTENAETLWNTYLETLGYTYPEGKYQVGT